MTPNQADELLRVLGEKPIALQDLHERVKATGSAWTQEQLQLFLLCAPGVEHETTTGPFQAAPIQADRALRDAIVEAVRSFAGRPIPASQVRARLPNHFVTTDEQILALSRRTAGLEVFGPNLIRIAP